MARATDWDNLARENLILEALISEWCINGEVEHLRNFSYELVERRAEQIGYFQGSENHRCLHIAVRNKIMWDAYIDVVEFLEANPTCSEPVTFYLATNEDMEKMLSHMQKADKEVVK